MAGADIQVSHGSIEEQGKTLGRMKNELEGDFQRALAQVNELKDSGAFVGLSGDGFQNKYTEWDTSIRKTLQLMEEFGTYLGTTSQAFADVDKAYQL